MVTTKTLRHYDSIGLLKPRELNNENGYRYYSVGQLGTMQKILRLKEYGFSLDEIKALIDADDDRLSNAMKEKLAVLYAVLRAGKAETPTIENDIEDLRKGDFVNSSYKYQWWKPLLR